MLRALPIRPCACTAATSHAHQQFRQYPNTYPAYARLTHNTTSPTTSRPPLQLQSSAPAAACDGARSSQPYMQQQHAAALTYAAMPGSQRADHAARSCRACLLLLLPLLPCWQLLASS